MCCFYLGDPNGAYSRFPVLIFIVLGCLGYNGDLVGSRRAIIFCQEISFNVRCSILLYCLLMMFV